MPPGVEEINESNINTVILIQLSRIYDVLLALYGDVNQEKAAYLGRMHEDGEFLGPDPAAYVTGQ